MSHLDHKTSVCDKCGRLMSELRKRFYCEFCKEYHHVCKTCNNNVPKCPRCGVRLMRKSEPAIHNVTLSQRTSF